MWVVRKVPQGLLGEGGGQEVNIDGRLPSCPAVLVSAAAGPGREIL